MAKGTDMEITFSLKAEARDAIAELSDLVDRLEAAVSGISMRKNAARHECKSCGLSRVRWRDGMCRSCYEADT